MADADKLKFRLRKLVKELEKHRARHTELISVYVPAEYNLELIIKQLQSEAGTARNIKSATTRKNVQAAIEKMIQHLRIYKKTPANGLAVFSGNVAEREGQLDVQVWAVEPTDQIKVKLYRCDQVFFLEPLKDQMLAKISYGLLVVDRREADIAVLRGKTITTLVSLKSAVPGKFKAGGQSAARLSRVIEGLAKDFFKKVGDAANEEFAKKEISGIIIGGPGPTKEDFASGDFLRTEVKKKVLAIKHLGYTGEFGLNELVEKSEDILIKEDITREKQAVNKFLEMLNKNPDLVAYGEAEVRKAIEAKAVDKLLLSEDLSDKVTEELMDKVEALGGEIIIISKETREGEQLVGMGGIAAILRFAF